MKDFYNRDVQVADKCILLLYSRIDEVTVLDIHDDWIKVINSLDEVEFYLVIKSALTKNIIDISALEREIHAKKLINSVKALNIKPEDTIVASLIPNQLHCGDAEELLNELQKMFPDNKVGLILGADLSSQPGDDEFEY